MYTRLPEPRAVDSVTLTATSSSVRVTWTTNSLSTALPHRVVVETTNGDSVHTDVVGLGTSSADVTTGIQPSTLYVVSVLAVLATPLSTQTDPLDSDALTERITTS